MSQPKTPINLVYIRAAIEAATGIRLKLEEVRRYLLEEGLITPKQAVRDATIFRGYGEFYDGDQGDFKKDVDSPTELNFQQEDYHSDDYRR